MQNSRRGHPCFDKAAHFRVGRIHLPVAPKCNISCRYCQRNLNKTENRPGVAANIITAEQALERTIKAIKNDPAIQIVGIAGPGDSLVNEETFETFKLIDKALPHLKKCLSTNGLLLPDRIADLLAVKIDSVSITINAVDPTISRQFYNGTKNMDTLIEKQLDGIRLASAAGISVKANSVLVPDLNANHLPEVAKAVKEAGATIMNIMPLKSIGKAKNWREPTCNELEIVRMRCEGIIEQFRLCQQCRADAVGIPGHHDPLKVIDPTPVYHY